MTSLLTRPDQAPQWGSMPGWDIVADLTPPELIHHRWIAVLRRRVAVGLVLVVALCAAAFAFASLRHSSASDEAEAASMRTTALSRSASQYAGITRIETTVSSLDAQVATVMKNDVDVARTVAAIRRALPRSMAIQSISVTLSPDGATDGATGLDASGRPIIGTVSISGSGRTLDDLPAFVDGLDGVTGVVNVVPASNTVSKGVADFSVTLGLTDRLYTHRFDVKAGSK